MTSIAVLGTGIMGGAMARRLAAAGFDVRVWNRSRDKAMPLAGAGASVAATPRDAADGADLILTMLADADAVAGTMSGPDGGLAPAGADQIWLQCSTVGVEGCERLAELAAAAGVAFVDSPVLGTREPAEQGKLVVLASGPEEARDRVGPVFSVVGQRTMWLGAAGAGSRLKLVANSWVLAVTTAVAEAMALAEGLELDPQLFLDAIEGGSLDLPYAHLKGNAMMERHFPPSFPLAGAAKDAGLITAAGKATGLDLAVATAACRRMEEARDAGLGDADMAAVWYAVTGG